MIAVNLMPSNYTPPQRATRWCTTCERSKPKADFYVGKDNTCKACQQARCSQWYRNNKAYHRERVDLFHAKERSTNPVRGMLRRKRGSCKARGVHFDLSVSDLTAPEFCPVLGVPLDYTSTDCSPNSATLDRIDPSKGYVRGNVAIISFKANRIKSNATPEELEAIAAWARKVM